MNYRAEKCFFNPPYGDGTMRILSVLVVMASITLVCSSGFAKPDQAKPDQVVATKPDQAKSEKAKPDQTRCRKCVLRTVRIRRHR